jgi:hypothetical protein
LVFHLEPIFTCQWQQHLRHHTDLQLEFRQRGYLVQDSGFNIERFQHSGDQSNDFKYIVYSRLTAARRHALLAGQSF